MRKVRISPKTDNVVKLKLFPCVEALYCWQKADPETDERDEAAQTSGAEDIILGPGSYLEAELLGYEHAFEGNAATRYDLVRLAKASTPKNASGVMISIHHGWISPDHFPLRAKESDSMVVEEINGDVKQWKLDLDNLFRSTGQNTTQAKPAEKTK